MMGGATTLGVAHTMQHAGDVVQNCLSETQTPVLPNVTPNPFNKNGKMLSVTLPIDFTIHSQVEKAF